MCGNQRVKVLIHYYLRKIVVLWGFKTAHATVTLRETEYSREKSVVHGAVIANRMATDAVRVPIQRSAGNVGLKDTPRKTARCQTGVPTAGRLVTSPQHVRCPFLALGVV